MGFCSTTLILFLVVIQMSAVVQCPFPPPSSLLPSSVRIRYVSLLLAYSSETTARREIKDTGTGPAPVLGSFSQSRRPQLWTCGLKNRVHAVVVLPRSYCIQPRGEILQSDYIPACAMRYTHADYLTVGTISIQMAIESTCSDRNGIGQS